MVDGRALQACKDLGVVSPCVQHKLYLLAREEAVVSMQDRGVRDPDEEDQGFDIHLMDSLRYLIRAQPGSQGTTPPLPPPKSPY